MPEEYAYWFGTKELRPWTEYSNLATSEEWFELQNYNCSELLWG